MSPSAELTPVASLAVNPGPKPLDASLLVTERIAPELEQVVPKPDDPIRKTQGCTTSHMLVVNWSKEGGWETPKIQPYGNLSLPPTSSVLHYGTECFVS